MILPSFRSLSNCNLFIYLFIPSVDELPFGGVGESGCMYISFFFFTLCGLLLTGSYLTFFKDGRQILKYSFDNFVYQRSIVDVPYQFRRFFFVYIIMPPF